MAGGLRTPLRDSLSCGDPICQIRALGLNQMHPPFPVVPPLSPSSPSPSCRDRNQPPSTSLGSPPPRSPGGAGLEHRVGGSFRKRCSRRPTRGRAQRGGRQPPWSLSGAPPGPGLPPSPLGGSQVAAGSRPGILSSPDRGSEPGPRTGRGTVSLESASGGARRGGVFPHPGQPPPTGRGVTEARGSHGNRATRQPRGKLLWAGRTVGRWAHHSGRRASGCSARLGEGLGRGPEGGGRCQGDGPREVKGA